MRAEMAESTAGAGRDALSAGISASLAKVRSFKSLVSAEMSQDITLKDGTTVNVESFYGMTDAKVADYLADVLAVYDAADPAGKKDIIAKQMLIAIYGNGLAAYNMWRRTGLPSNMSPALEADPGTFAYRMRYPQDYTTRNSNYDEANDLITNRVFWNASGPTLY